MDNIDNLSEIIQQTEEYKQVCDQCKDEILIYPTISGRTNFTQEEVILYNATLMAVMDIDTFQLSIEEVVGNDEIKLSLNEVEIIDNFLK